MLFKFLLSYILGPQKDATSGDPDASASFEELIYLQDASVGARYTLSSDAAQPINFAGLASAGAIVLVGTGKFTAVLTSSAGATQRVPVDTILALTCQGAPVTAIDLLRTPGVLVTVKVFLGEIE